MEKVEWYVNAKLTFIFHIYIPRRDFKILACQSQTHEAERASGFAMSTFAGVETSSSFVDYWQRHGGALKRSFSREIYEIYDWHIFPPAYDINKFLILFIFATRDSRMRWKNMCGITMNGVLTLSLDVFLFRLACLLPASQSLKRICGGLSGNEIKLNDEHVNNKVNR